MAAWTIPVLLCIIIVFTEAKTYQKREVHNLCTDDYTNTTKKIECKCHTAGRQIRYKPLAECYLTGDVVEDEDVAWDTFNDLQNFTSLVFANTRGITLKYIPTKAFKYMKKIIKVELKSGNIRSVHELAFSNSSTINEIAIIDSQVTVLDANAFAHHKDLRKITLDTNAIVEINRNVFVDLPSLDKLFLTNNEVTTVHDRAFSHLLNLKELEMNGNKLFSLNAETFIGLSKLQKLDLSRNNLEVIGDNTFLPLINLKHLNLEQNKIQMLDDKAFNGLSNLMSLSLGRNKLLKIDSIKVFEGLNTLSSLNLRANDLKELKFEVMIPILENFFGEINKLDVEDNNFSCGCHLDWFMSLMNRTTNKNLQHAIDNLKCEPDAKLRELKTKLDEQEKTAELNEENNEDNDYEYYDDTQLDGKLFYSDIRSLINCTNLVNHIFTTPVTSPHTTEKVKAYTKATPSLDRVTSVPERSTTKVAKHGLLDLSLEETTRADDSTKKYDKSTNNGQNAVSNERKYITHTTTRLATVSAKPIDNKDYEAMASDEAKPEKLHRSIKNDISHELKLNPNNAFRSYISDLVLLTMLSCRIFL